MARRRAKAAQTPESDARLQALGGRLAAELHPWFVTHRRDLSWRRTTDPYRIWVSEVMLQQTRVETVERYWPAFVQRFPSVQALARADLEAVLQAWSGLGYYRRARLLHEGARFVARELGGVLPEDAAALQKIPGIGRYTAGAIASIAFDQPAPLVDGNVARVLSRVRAVEDPKGQGADAAEHWSLAAVVLGHGSPRVLAQALMELGATVCTPRSPTCPTCPIRFHCNAAARGLADVIPAPRKKATQPVQHWRALAVSSRQRLLLVRRPGQGLLAGMWCLPLVVDGDAAIESLLGVPAEPRDAGPNVRHVFTHRIWEMKPVRIELPRRPPLPGLGKDDRIWVRRRERPAGGVPSVTRKLLDAIGW